VLDVGCATGYSAAVLARLAARVVALEEDATLARAATANSPGVGNVSVVTGPAPAGWQQGGPYDVILLEGPQRDPARAALRAARGRWPLLAVIGTRADGKATIYTKAGRASPRSPVRRRRSRAARFREAARIRVLTAGRYRCARQD
jgi:protein-L-isoaspartate(D-aspartate) O-methyltransferase